MRANQILCFDNGEDLVSKINLSPPLVSATVRSKVMVLLLLVH